MGRSLHVLAGARCRVKLQIAPPPEVGPAGHYADDAEDLKAHAEVAELLLEESDEPVVPQTIARRLLGSRFGRRLALPW